MSTVRIRDRLDEAKDFAAVIYMAASDICQDDQRTAIRSVAAHLEEMLTSIERDLDPHHQHDGGDA